jgi:NADH:ubiquinone oxidoreductase subunit 6 (subunit J)
MDDYFKVTSNAYIDIVLSLTFTGLSYAAYWDSSPSERNSVMGIVVILLGVHQALQCIATMLWMMGKSRWPGGVWDTWLIVWRLIMQMLYISLAIVALANAWESPCKGLEGFICSYSTFLIWWFLVGLCMIAFLILCLPIAAITLAKQRKALKEKTAPV